MNRCFKMENQQSVDGNIYGDDYIKILTNINQ